ncbi:hypothetical protein [Bradyrhizobium liaoningense]
MLRHTFLRALLLLFGIVGVAWSLGALPSFWLTAPVLQVSAQIMADGRYKPSALAGLLPRIEAAQQLAMVQPEFSRAGALIVLRTAEDTMQRESPEIAERQVEDSENSVRASLFVTPSDSFLWLMLFSVETARTGFDRRSIAYLDQSYTSGPLEAWIVLRRNRLALAIFPMLSDATQTCVISEFAAMVDSGLIEVAAINLMGTGRAYQERLLTALSSVDIMSKASLYKQLSAEGIKFKIPGIEIDERPWK